MDRPSRGKGETNSGALGVQARNFVRAEFGSEVAAEAAVVARALFVLVLCATAYGCGSRAAIEAPARIEPVSWSVALDHRDGAWAPHVVGGDVYLVGTRFDPDALEVSEPATSVTRLDARDGSERWRTELRGRGGAIALQVGGDTLVVVQGSSVEALDRRDGRYLWGVRYDAAPTRFGVDATLLAVALPDGRVDVRGARSGERRWTLDLGAWRVGRFAGHDGRLYALAVSGATGAQRLGAFDLTRPSAMPVWDLRFSSAMESLGVSGGLVAGRIGGFDLAFVRLEDGRAVDADGERPGGGSWLSGVYATAREYDGVVLRMRRVDAYALGGSDAPLWSTTITTGSVLELVDPDLRFPAVLATSAASASLLDARTGALLWSVRLDGWDDEGRSCTIAGALDRALLQRCSRLADDVLVALEVSRD